MVPGDLVPVNAGDVVKFGDTIQTNDSKLSTASVKILGLVLTNAAMYFGKEFRVSYDWQDENLPSFKHMRELPPLPIYSDFEKVPPTVRSAVREPSLELVSSQPARNADVIFVSQSKVNHDQPDNLSTTELARAESPDEMLIRSPMKGRDAFSLLNESDEDETSEDDVPDEVSIDSPSQVDIDDKCDAPEQEPLSVLSVSSSPESWLDDAQGDELVDMEIGTIEPAPTRQDDGRLHTQHHDDRQHSHHDKDCLHSQDDENRQRTTPTTLKRKFDSMLETTGRESPSVERRSSPAPQKRATSATQNRKFDSMADSLFVPSLEEQLRARLQTTEARLPAAETPVSGGPPDVQSQELLLPVEGDSGTCLAYMSSFDVPKAQIQAAELPVTGESRAGQSQEQVLLPVGGDSDTHLPHPSSCDGRPAKRARFSKSVKSLSTFAYGCLTGAALFAAPAAALLATTPASLREEAFNNFQAYQMF